VTFPTSLPTKVPIPVLSTNLPSSSILPKPVPSSSTLSLIDLPVPTSIPTGLRGPFEAPHLIVPIDKANPSRVVGNGYTAQLSPDLSTVFVFDIRPEHQDKLCNLVFYMPSAFPFADLAPVKIRSPGGINVSRLSSNRVATPEISANSIGRATHVGTVPSIQFGNQYTVTSMPCEAGQKVAYKVDSIGGLTMDFFQMTSPPLGLFVSVV
jgi:glucan endo-1,3-beta-D-glucosidase